MSLKKKVKKKKGKKVKDVTCRSVVQGSEFAPITPRMPFEFAPFSISKLNLS